MLMKNNGYKKISFKNRIKGCKQDSVKNPIKWKKSLNPIRIEFKTLKSFKNIENNV